MRAIRLDNLLRPNRAYRAIAIFFLVFTVIDLACPWLCQEDFAGVIGAGQAQKASGANIRAGLGGEEQQQDHDSQSGLIEEDCFCCCTHVQPSYRPILPAINFDNSGFLLPPAGLPTSPPISTYRPPRSASC
jgi:hypothetical protein